MIFYEILELNFKILGGGSEGKPVHQVLQCSEGLSTVFLLETLGQQLMLRTARD